MASQEAELYSSLVKWLDNCLAMGGTLVFDETSLNNGVAIADCLVQLAPDFFTFDWRGKIISETADNWKLRHNNMKKIYRSLMDYYGQFLHVSLGTFIPPNLELIAEQDSRADMTRLIQLMLGVAINCEHKDMYIQAIMSLQQEVQHVVMGAIQDLMSYQSPSMVTGEDYKELEAEHKKVVEELENLRGEEDNHLQQNHELQTQLKVLTEEKEELAKEVGTLKNKLKEVQFSAGVSDESKAVQLQRQVDNLRNEKLHLGTERDDLKHKMSDLEAQFSDLFQKNRDLQLENDEIPILRDSLEEMKYLEGKVKSYESVISQYKKKLEDAHELRKQLKTTEDKNVMYMQQNFDLEEELRRLSGVRGQLDHQKQRIQELENILAQEKLKCLEISQEAEDKSQTVDTLMAEIIQVKKDRDDLSVQVPGTPLTGELGMFSYLTKTGSFDQPDLGGVASGLDLQEAYTPELRERMAKLEKENEILRRRLEYNATDTESPLGRTSSSGGIFEQKVSEQIVTIEKQQRDVADLKNKLELLVRKAKEQKAQISSLEDAKNNKNAEIEKYKKYLNKAKKIIETFGGSKSQSADDTMEVQTLRSSLKEKEKAHDHLEKEYNQEKLAWEREEKLVVSSWYEMGLMMHHKYSQERLLNHHGGSFLAQQRSALYKRPVPFNTSVASTSSHVSTVE